MLTVEALEAIANNKEFDDKELLKEVVELFSAKPEASKFIGLYGTLCELMDDMVDETVTIDMVDQLGRLRHSITECPFWQKHYNHLFLVERIIHNQFFDAVKWEKSDEEWKRRDARALTHCAYNMLFAIIIIEFGYDKLDELSLRFRTHAHLRHLKDYKPLTTI